MSDLGIIDLYERSDKKKAEEFKNQIEGVLHVKKDVKRVSRDTEWIDMMELTIPYIDRIFRNPNRFIINEEEIVKIEQAKKVGVETIKHLSKNTNFIQKLDEKTGDVIPSKLLNVRKEESYNTYENRLIYTLVQNMKLFMKRRLEFLDKEIENSDKDEKDNKFITYNAKSKINDEKVDVDLSLNSYLDPDSNSQNNELEEIMLRIENLKKSISALAGSDTYKVIDSAHSTLVKEPIKKTNVVKKNVNFQYAMKLWDYLRDNFDEKTSDIEDNDDYDDTGRFKELIDESFLLQYMALKTIDGDGMEDKEVKRQIEEQMIGQMIDNMLDIDTDLSQEDLSNVIIQKFEVIKYKKMAAIKELQNIFKKHIEKYTKKVEE